MLRRQQVEAIISASEKIVEGAVSMVEMALDKLADELVITSTIRYKKVHVSFIPAVHFEHSCWYGTKNLVAWIAIKRHI